MIAPSRSIAVAVSLFLCLIWLPTSLAAQIADPDKVFFTGPSNTISEVLNFVSPTGGAAQSVITQGGTNFQGLTVRGDGLIIVANPTTGGGITICNLLGDCRTIVPFSDAHAVTLSPSQDIFAINRTVGGVDQVIKVTFDPTCSPGLDQTDPTCRPGGYKGIVVIDPDVTASAGAQALTDVKFVRFTEETSGGVGVETGDLVVLFQKPAKLVKYPGAAPCTASPCPVTLVDTPQFSGMEPRGGSFSPNAQWLTTVKENRILRHNVTTGGRVMPDFASLPGTPAKITVGVQEGVNRAFVAIQTSSGRIQRYRFASNGTGTFEGEATVNVSTPEGVSIGSENGSPTLTGTEVETLLAGTTIWEEVTKDGITIALCTTFADPRESDPSCSASPGQPLACGLVLCDPSADSNCPASLVGPNDHVVNLGFPKKVPRYARGFSLPGLGNVPGFRFCLEQTTATFLGIILDIYDASELGAHSCAPNPPQVFYTPGPSESTIVENPFFTDTSVCCENPLGGAGGRRSGFLTAVDDVRNKIGQLPRSVPTTAGPCAADGTDGIMPCKLSKLRETVSSFSSCISNTGTFNKLLREVDGAIGEFEAGDDAGAISELQAFIAEVEKAVNQNRFNSCPTSAEADLRARAQSAIYVEKLILNDSSPGSHDISCTTLRNELFP